MSLAIPSYQPCIIQNINNNILSGRMCMPLKGLNSAGDSLFSQGRQQYYRAHSSIPVTNATQIHKKWFRDQSSSSVTQRRQYDAIAQGSLNFGETPMHLSAGVEKNTVNDALRRVRSSGYVTTKKVRAKPANALTPSFPAGPLIRTDQRAPVAVWGDPVHGQYTTMRQKEPLNLFIPWLTNSSYYNRVRKSQGVAMTQTVLYH